MLTDNPENDVHHSDSPDGDPPDDQNLSLRRSSSVSSESDSDDESKPLIPKEEQKPDTPANPNVEQKPNKAARLKQKWDQFTKEGWTTLGKLAPFPVFEEGTGLAKKASRWFDWVLNILNLTSQILCFMPEPDLFITGIIIGIVIGLVGGLKTFIEVIIDKKIRSRFFKDKEGFLGFLEGTIALLSFALNTAAAVFFSTAGSLSLMFNLLSNIDNIITGTYFFVMYLYHGIKSIGRTIMSAWDYHKEKSTPENTSTKPTFSSQATTVKLLKEEQEKSSRNLSESVFTPPTPATELAPITEKEKPPMTPMKPKGFLQQVPTEKNYTTKELPYQELPRESSVSFTPELST